MLQGKHILIIVENLPVPFDRRVWQEANALVESGAKVSIICPKMKQYQQSFETLNGIDVYRHVLPAEANSAAGYLIEYGVALFWEFFLSWKVFFKNRFHVIHGCNPPDLIFLVALFFKPFGVKYVFDHHDINPELYESKFRKKGFFHKLLLIVERLTFKTADFSIATNESFKHIAIKRGGMHPEKVQIVRSGPSLTRFKLMPPKDCYRKGKKFLIGYIGVIAEQDGLDVLVEIAQILKRKKTDVHFAIIGGGTELEKVKTLAKTLRVDDMMDFYGLISDDQLINEILNTCDVCVNPDPPGVYNNQITTNKVMEYMALKKPIVQFDLMEGRFSSREASLYASDTDDFSEKIIWLLDNEPVRKQMGEIGYKRVIDELSWNCEKEKLVNFYNEVVK